MRSLGEVEEKELKQRAHLSVLTISLSKEKLRMNQQGQELKDSPLGFVPLSCERAYSPLMVGDERAQACSCLRSTPVDPASLALLILNVRMSQMEK